MLIGGLPYPDKETSGRFKLAILKLLHDKYGITERDFVTAEIEIVPAQKARDVGLDSSFIGAYGQDDRVCAYTAMSALTNLEKADKTAVCLLFDKEEIGSDGNTGAQSRVYEYLLYELYARSLPELAQPINLISNKFYKTVLFCRQMLLTLLTRLIQVFQTRETTVILIVV